MDLLTTGIDVPEICNLVFLRRVNSRILFDQMLGRATRLVPGDRQGDLPHLRCRAIYEALQQHDRHAAGGGEPESSVSAS